MVPQHPEPSKTLPGRKPEPASTYPEVTAPKGTTCSRFTLYTNHYHLCAMYSFFSTTVCIHLVCSFVCPKMQIMSVNVDVNCVCLYLSPWCVLS